MKNLIKITLTICFIFGTLSSFSQTKLYIHPNSNKYVKNTKSIAILPLAVQVKLRPKELAALTPEQIEDMGNKEALDIQKAMHTWFLTRKQRGEFVGEVLSVMRTNALLTKAGYDIHNLNLELPSDLGKVLGVDCVVMGTFETNKPLSSGAAIGMALLGGFGATSSAVCNLDFYNVEDDELVVNYNKKVSGGLGSDAQDLINTLMRKVTRRIPYTSR